MAHFLGLTSTPDKAKSKSSMPDFSSLRIGGSGKQFGTSKESNTEQLSQMSVKFDRFSGLASTSIGKLEGELDSQSHLWTHCSASTFHTRTGPNYFKNKKKAPSGNALMELVGTDLVRTPARIDKIGSKIRIPEEFFSVNTNEPGVPPLFIVNAQVPSEFPTSLSGLFGSEITDGPGWSIVYYFRMSQETSDSIANLENASAAIKLFVDYCKSAPEMDSDPKSPWKGRFKAMYRCENMDDFGLPSFITSYNAKPVLINRTGVLSRGENFIEMDINLHKFSSIAKKGLQVLIPYFEKMIVTGGFCIESVDDEEMPEQLFGIGTCIRANYRIAPDIVL